MAAGFILILSGFMLTVLFYNPADSLEEFLTIWAGSCGLLLATWIVFKILVWSSNTLEN